MPRLTKEGRELQQAVALNDAHAEGFQSGLREQEARLKEQYSLAKLQQMQAAAKIAEEVGRMASRLGYMIGKINGDNSR